jgi:general secretion pathway protein F
LLQSLYYARFSRVLGFLIEGGMPMLRALRLSAKSIGNKAVESSVLKAEAQVAEGQRLSAALEGFPPVLLQLISTGEKSGRLSENLKHAADAYEEAFNRKVEKAIALIEPSIIIAMGIIVCFIVLGVLLPMFQLNQLVK